MTDVSLRYMLFGEDKSASKAFKGTSKAAESASKSISTHAVAIGAAMGTFVGGAALNVAAALGQMGVSAATAGIKTASNMEQAQIAFTKLLGSGKQAQTFLGQLSTFAAATPFELPGLIDASRQLLGAGAAAKDVIPTLTAYGDAAGALGISQDGFNHIMLATTQAMAAGTLHAGDLLQMTEAGLPVWKLMSEALGKPVATLQKMSAKGQLLSKDVLPKLQAQMEKDYGGSMAKQSQTLSGLWSTLMDTFNQGMAKVIIPLEPLLRQAIPAAASFMGKALAGIASFMTTKVVPGIRKAIDIFGDMRQAFQFGRDWESHSPFERIAIGARIVVDFIRTKVIPIIASFGGWLKGDLWPALQKGAQIILPGLRQALGILRNTFKGTGDGGQKFGDIIKGAGKIIVQYVIPILATLISKWLPMLAHEWQAIIFVVGAVIKVAQTLGTVWLGAIKFVLNATSNLLSMWASMLRALSHVPGFGWAADAAKKMQGAADKASGLARAIDNIQRDVTIGVQFKVMAGRIKVGNQSVNVAMRAGGGPVRAGMPYMVGEHEPEMFIPGQSGTILNGRQMAAMRGNGGLGVIEVVLKYPDGTVVERQLVSLKRSRGGRLAFQ